MSVVKIAWDEKTLTSGSLWLLNKNINGYENVQNDLLATEAISGRKFEILTQPKPGYSPLHKGKIKVRLLEDGYICYFKLQDLIGHIERTQNWNPILLTKTQIIEKLPQVLSWVRKASKVPNYYLWGGTEGPNFDCSGLIQAAFSSEKIWLPRDAYQQEQFCTKIEWNPKTLTEIRLGDLLFFGERERCTHVGLYKGAGAYWHSSGSEDGRNGIGIDYLNSNNNEISSNYFSKLRGAGRVEHCYDGQSFYK